MSTLDEIDEMESKLTYLHEQARHAGHRQIDPEAARIVKEMREIKANGDREELWDYIVNLQTLRDAEISETH